jgi:1,4-alpha-glucan branching enzyme
MDKGYFAFVLHAHLPFVRHPEEERILEELWLYEAISETYLPLLRVFDRLEKDGIPFKLTLSISPTLLAMLEDELLQDRYVTHLERLLELAEKEALRTGGDAQFHPLALMYRDMYGAARRDFVDLYGKRILKGFSFFMKRGRLEIITTAATHAYLPLYEMYPETVRAQVQIAAQSHCRAFGKVPRGFFLPELGYYPGVEDILKESGFTYFFVAAHGVLFVPGCPRRGIYAPLACPNGLAAFGRDIASANALWSSREGYPGDFSYRDFYRDIGFDLPLDYVAPYLRAQRGSTGFKYYAVTGQTDQKVPYAIAAARKKIEEHADNFIYSRLLQIKKLGGTLDRPPLIVSPYDAELFGHWWFEGPEWIETLCRKLAKTEELQMIFPQEYLAKYPENQRARPVFSSWGNKGYSEVWLDGSNDWIYRHIHKAVERMGELARRYPDEKGLKERALNQAAREVLLSQASDWPFIMHAGTTVPYAVRRVREHLASFTNIYDALSSGTVSTEWLTKLERQNNIFPEMDYRIFGG